MNQNCIKHKVIFSKELCQTAATRLNLDFKLVEGTLYKEMRPAGCYSTRSGPKQEIYFNDYEAATSGVGAGRVAICIGKGMAIISYYLNIAM